MDKPNLDYERDIQIDHNALDVEWVRQSELMYRYTKHAAQTRATMDEAKERLDVVKARLDAAIRENPPKYGLDGRVTEAAIQNAILLQREYEEASHEYAETRYENDIAQGAVRAIDQRKTALENLVRLLGMSYFAGPQAPRDLDVEFEQSLRRKKQQAENSRVKIQRRNK